MPYEPQNPLIVQSDRSLLLEVDNTLYEAARDALVRFAELEKSPEHIHTYRITPLSLWNAAAAGTGFDDIGEALEQFSKYPVPQNVLADIQDQLGRYGRIKLLRDDQGRLLLTSEDRVLLVELSRNKKVQPFLREQLDEHTILIRGELRGHLKQVLLSVGYPVEDLAGYLPGTA